MSIRTMTMQEFHAALLAQEVPNEHLAVICPICQTVQSATDLIRAGAGATMDEVERYLGFSCVGRWTNAGPFHSSKRRRAPEQRGCDWTLGGLFRLHRLEVVADDGKHHPRFEVASPEQAQQLMRENANRLVPPTTRES
ncbi:MAG: hypothetical protein KGI63_12270 [Xanthomonadaceae bacterium]|nr:hypothetical protein [Xanthomonadaceae bacterium]